jgi:beta propeller repeat protein
MNERNLYAPALVLIALALLTGAATAAEIQVTNASVDQVYASVLDDRILWSDNRTGDYDVYLYNLTEEGERTLSPAATDQFATALPAGTMMSGDKVVWEDNRTGNRDIYLYDLATGEETQITNGTGHEINPAVAGDWIVWQDDRNGNWDIYLYDIATEEETRITTNESAQMTPAVTESMVVWNDYRHGNWDIYAWTPDEAAPSAPGPAGAPDPGAPPAPPAPGADPAPPPPGTTTPPTTSAPIVTSTATPTPTPEEDYEVGEVPPGSSPESQGGQPVTPVTWIPIEVTPRIPLPSELGDPPLVVTPTPPLPGPL